SHRFALAIVAIAEDAQELLLVLAVAFQDALGVAAHSELAQHGVLAGALPVSRRQTGKYLDHLAAVLDEVVEHHQRVLVDVVALDRPQRVLDTREARGILIEHQSQALEEQLLEIAEVGQHFDRAGAAAGTGLLQVLVAGGGNDLIQAQGELLQAIDQLLAVLQVERRHRRRNQVPPETSEGVVAWRASRSSASRTAPLASSAVASTSGMAMSSSESMTGISVQAARTM